MASSVKDAPGLLSVPAATAVFEEALSDETNGGRRKPLGPLAGQAGWRRRLRRRIAAWTTQERHRDRDWAEPADETAAAERSVFHRYRRLLEQLKAEDEAGLAVWASIRLRDRAARSGGDGDHLVFLDFPDESPAQWRTLIDVLERPRSVDVTLCYENAEDRAELYLAASSLRERLLERGMTESAVPSCPQRPAGLRAVDALLFSETDLRIETSDGLHIRGGPVGMDLGRMVAREVKSLHDQGVDPDEILVGFPRWDDQAEAVCEAMRGAGLPIHDAAPKALDRDPGVAAALQAARIPAAHRPGEEWEADAVVRLLRNGRLQPSWDGGIDRFALAEAASTLRRLDVFRGGKRILTALAREIARSEEAADPAEQASRKRRIEQAMRAHPILENLIGALDTLNRPRPRGEHVAELRRAVGSLGIGRNECRALETLWDAAEERADVLERLGRDRAEIAWVDFVDELADLAAETAATPTSPAPGSTRTTLVDDLPGCRAGHVVLAGLVEGSFPRRPAVQPFLTLKPGEEIPADARRQYAVEALRFARALGAADRGAHLFYPTTDAKGQPLLRAGFLDDLVNALSPTADAACHVARARFHPALIGDEDLAIAPSDARVLAAAKAAEQGRMGKLRALARDPAHREPLEGAAAALYALESRRKGMPFGSYDGLLEDADALGRLAKEFGPAEHTFSPSQLETYLLCPFQFFSRHVLHLEPIIERHELDEDYTERGSRLHDILEEFERRRIEAAGAVADDRLLVEAVDKVLAHELNDLSELELGLREIEQAQTRRVIEQYARQRSDYESKSETPPIPRHFELNFGEPGAEHPEFELALGAEVVRLKGRIDRVDVVETGPVPQFRVIDYKSGHAPSGKDVTEQRMLQLPLYAMAVERLVYQNGGAALLDVGYWGLKDKGFKPILLEQWAEFREALIERVFAVVKRLQSGTFPVAPQKDGCESYCEYRSVCRIRQVRNADKAIEVVPGPSTDKTLSGRPAKKPGRSKAGRS